MNRNREWFRITHLSPRLAPGLCDFVEVEPVEAINWNPDTMPRPKVLREVWWRIALGDAL